ncbi:MAG: TonB-dependent receptor [Saprospiraceae bacterium]|nr:TonB-dependent receptor [Saprospiraceae bacterium]
MQKSILLFLFALLACPVWSQQSTLLGRILDEDAGRPLEFAAVSVLNATDSTLINGGISDQDGTFFLTLSPGQYLVQVDYIAYTSLLAGPVRIAPGQTLDMGDLQIHPEAALLSEIEVNAEKNQMQLTLDKKIYNVGKDIANTGSTAADILDNVPSVTVDVEGNVSLRGSSGVRILIDGRPSGLIGVGDSDGLRSLPSNMIDRIEVVTNPSARYEAEGMAGIINIVLKKERQQGWNGSFETTLGYPLEWGGAANLNYRRSRINLFANYGIRYRTSLGGGTQYQEFYRNDSIFINDQVRDHDRNSLSHNVRFGLDLFIGQGGTLTTAFNYRYSQDDNLTKLTYHDYLEDLQHPLLITRRSDNEDELEPTLEYALNWKKTFGRDDHVWTADARYQDNAEHERSDFLEQYFLPDGNQSSEPDKEQRSDNMESERNIIFQSDYQYPLSKTGKIEAGIRAGLRDIDNDFLVEERMLEEWAPLVGFNNQFRYDEDIYAAYAIWGEQWKPVSVQAGLRYEYTDISTELVETGEQNPRTYGELFPSAHISFQLPQDQSLQVSYSRRINRPEFRSLNPFLTFSDVRNIWTGNPDLDPELTNAFEVGHIKTWAKGSISPVLFYRKTDHVIDRIRTVDADGISYIRPENLDIQHDMGLEVTFSYEPFAIWRVNGNVNFFRSITDGTNLGEEFTADAYTWFGRLSSRVTLFQKVDLQINYNYRAPRVTTQGKYLAMQHLDMGASMDVLKNKGTVTLSGRDIFNTRRRIYENRGEDFYTRGNFQWRRGSVNLTFAYRLNQQKTRDNKEGGTDGGDGF